MILAGDIGATRTRLAAFETEGNRLQCVVEKIYMSQEHGGLAEILAHFIREPRAFPFTARASAWPGRCARAAARFPIFPGSSIPANWPSNSS